MTDAKNTPPVRVMIADDHPLIVEGLTSALVRFNLDVVGQALTTTDVLDSYGRVKPDVLVLDVRFGEGVTGLDVARQLLAKDPSAKIIIYSQFDSDEIVREAYLLGCKAFLPKSTPAATLASTVHQVNQGETFFLPEIATRLALLSVRGQGSGISALDQRELEVFKKMALGMTNQEIADAMSLSLKTISLTSQHIKETLRLHRPADVTLLAVKHGLIDIPR